MIPNHECSLYCRPDEGLHCELCPITVRPSDAGQASMEGALEHARATQYTGQWHFRGRRLQPERIEIAAEPPPLSMADVERIKREHVPANVPHKAKGRTHYLGCLLVWFRVPAEVLT